MKNKLFVFFITIIISLAGCRTTLQQDSTIAKYMIPVNVVAAYFGAVTLHEGGHALSAEGFGADVTHFSVLPERRDDGHLNLGLTKFEGDYSDSEHTAILAMGPTAQFLGHVSMRELLKTGQVPRFLQPTLAWFGLFNQMSYYYHAVNGMLRNDRTDLGRVDHWISFVMFGGALLYDIYDFMSADLPEQKYRVLFGEDYYEPEPPSNFRVLSAPTRGGGFLGIEFDF